MVYTLADVVEQNRKFPTSFHIESEMERSSVPVGSYAKLIFRPTDGRDGAERMWVQVTTIEKLGDVIRYRGTLANCPVVFDELHFGDVVDFEPKHVADIRAVQ